MAIDCHITDLLSSCLPFKIFKILNLISSILFFYQFLSSFQLSAISYLTSSVHNCSVGFFLHFSLLVFLMAFYCSICTFQIFYSKWEIRNSTTTISVAISFVVVVVVIFLFFSFFFVFTLWLFLSLFWKSFPEVVTNVARQFLWQPQNCFYLFIVLFSLLLLVYAKIKLHFFGFLKTKENCFFMAFLFCHIVSAYVFLRFWN